MRSRARSAATAGLHQPEQYRWLPAPSRIAGHIRLRRRSTQNETKRQATASREVRRRLRPLVSAGAIAFYQNYSQAQVEKSFSNCGTSFHTPFSFLLAIVINCGWNRKPATASVASIRCASPSSFARPASSGVAMIC
ncbi:hypothetical protein ACVIGB_007924 [Bradyrhizobium sp. USDA 4341]